MTSAANKKKPLHVIALPYPGRGHVNPMMSLCKQLSTKQPHILITFVLTEEWFTFIASESKPYNIRFLTIPNVIPSELVRATNFRAFFEAVSTKTEAPFERLLDSIDYPVAAILADTYMVWVPDLGKRRSIPVASFWTMSATVFSIFHHIRLLVKNGHYPVPVSEWGDVVVDYIPGVSPTKLIDFPTIFSETSKPILEIALRSVKEVSKVEYILFTSVYELESQVVDALKDEFPFPVYTIGPTIPFFQLNQSGPNNVNGPSYFQWLDSQPAGSVLYVSLGSFLSVSSTQMEEIIAGIRDSCVRFMFIARGETLNMFSDGCGENGIVVPWCDQLRVLCHSSIGGFWSHCGFNSTLEALYSGVPLLTFPIFWDQVTNCKKIVEDWKIGWRVKKMRETGNEVLVKRDEIAQIVKRFMDPHNPDKKEMQIRARKVHEICQAATSLGGSSDTNLDVFLSKIIS